MNDEVDAVLVGLFLLAVMVVLAWRAYVYLEPVLAGLVR